MQNQGRYQVQDLDQDQLLCCNQASPHLQWIYKNIYKPEISDVRVGLENKKECPGEVGRTH